jgi:hypothetical protein
VDAQSQQPRPASPTDDTNDADWILPGYGGTPAQALARIGTICAGIPDLFNAMLAVLGTHQTVSREILALAIKQCRPDIADLSRNDVVALLTSIRNGGWQGFDAVLRSRRRGERSGERKVAAALPWTGQ